MSQQNARPEEGYFAKYFEHKTLYKRKQKKEKKGDIDDEMEEDAFADELFEKQLQGGVADDEDDDEDFLDGGGMIL